MKSIDIRFSISDDGQIQYQGDWRKRFEEFKMANRLTEGIMTYRVKSGDVELWQHKYYRGYLLPAIASETYSGDLQVAHRALKEQFLFYALLDENEIPRRFRGKCEKYYHTVPTGEGHKTVKFFGFIPSTADLTADEMNSFMTRVEHLGLEYGVLKVDEAGAMIRHYAEVQVPDEKESGVIW